jgi:hypothetical protein
MGIEVFRIRPMALMDNLFDLVFADRDRLFIGRSRVLRLDETLGSLFAGFLRKEILWQDCGSCEGYKLADVEEQGGGVVGVIPIPGVFVSNFFQKSSIASCGDWCFTFLGVGSANLRMTSFPDSCLPPASLAEPEILSPSWLMLLVLPQG